MSEVRWSSAIHVYTPDSRLVDLLGDIKRLAAEPPGAEPAFLVIRFAEDDWYVLPVAAGAGLSKKLGSGSGASTRLREAAPQLRSSFSRAFVLAPDRPRAYFLPAGPSAGAWHAIELDASGRPLRVGMLAADSTKAGKPAPPTKAQQNADWSAEKPKAAGRIVLRSPMPRRSGTPASRSISRPSPPAPADAGFLFVWPEAPVAKPERMPERMTPARSRAPQRRSEPEVQGPRYIQGDLYRKAGTRWLPSEAELAVKEKYRFDVFIGPPGLGSIQADTAFRDDALDWSKADSYRLQVVFAEIGRDAEAQSKFIDLPRTGKSSTCSFLFSPKRLGAFSVRISVLHEGRVLQTAVIRTTVEKKPRQRKSPGESPALRPTVEMVVRHDLGSLDGRQHFDASLILNHANDGAAAMTAASQDGAYVASLDDLQAQLASISALLVELATKSKIHTKKLTSKENAAWFVRLAAEGCYLHRKLVRDYIGKSATAAALEKAEYLQIVSARPDSVVPLEFVYEYSWPKDDAPVCENAVKALEDGKCPESCRQKRESDPADCVCPMGFWGLSRVIERHVFDPDLPKPAKILAVEPTAKRNAIDVRGASLLAISKQVKAAEQEKLADRVKQHWKGSVAIAESWDAWKRAVGDNRPVLFIVLPHTTGKGAQIALEIHGDTRKSGAINEAYVNPTASTTSPPIVLLLGCDTSSTADKDAYTTNITVFRQAGSAIVLATTAALVWGDDSAKVAGQVVEALDGALTEAPQRFGEILRTAKRKSVAGSQLMAMCLAAFGDAEWQISAKQGA